MFRSGAATTRVVVALVLLAAAVLWVAMYSRPSPPASQPIRRVVLISLDTCRPDRLGCYGHHQKTTPRIDALARQGVLFRHALSPAPMALPAHSSMLTGTNPLFHGVRADLDYRLGSASVTLAELLQARGFTTGAIVGASVLDARFGLDQGFDTYDDRIEEYHGAGGIAERKGGEVTRLALEWLECHQDGDFFLFLHYYDPHHPYQPPRSFASSFAYDLYAGEIAFTDYCIGRVVAKLEELGLFDSTLIVITGGHGEMLGEHQEKTHGYFVYQAALEVPLIFKLPGRRDAATVSDRVGLMDVVPTICGLLGIQAPTGVQGRDLTSYLDGQDHAPGERNLYCESLTPTRYGASALLGVVGQRWKYIHTTRPELYDLLADPAESRNLADARPEQVSVMQGRLRDFLEEQRRPEDSDSLLARSEADVRRLDSPAYLARGEIVDELDFDSTREDPKDVIAIHEARGLLVQLMSREDYEEAELVCQGLLRKHPNAAEGHLYMASIAKARDDLPRAIRHLQQALNLDPDSVLARTQLSNALNAADKLE